jgi:hypothetical protein
VRLILGNWDRMDSWHCWDRIRGSLKNVKIFWVPDILGIDKGWLARNCSIREAAGGGESWQNGT